jgi:hypothetical protein
MRTVIILFAGFFVILFNGCLIFHKISYEVKLEGSSGTAEVVFYDLRSDAENPSEFEEDKNNLFDYMWKSSQFITDMQEQGKNIIERDLYLSNDTLNGRVVFTFSSINNVENIMLEDDFYYLTLPLEDSVMYTNGEIIKSQEYKRILWDSSFDEIEFDIMGFSFDEERYRPLGYHFKSLK